MDYLKSRNQTLDAFDSNEIVDYYLRKSMKQDTERVQIPTDSNSIMRSSITRYSINNIKEDSKHTFAILERYKCLSNKETDLNNKLARKSIPRVKKLLEPNKDIELPQKKIVQSLTKKQLIYKSRNKYVDKSSSCKPKDKGKFNHRLHFPTAKDLNKLKFFDYPQSYPKRGQAIHRHQNKHKSFGLDITPTFDNESIEKRKRVSSIIKSIQESIKNNEPIKLNSLATTPYGKIMAEESRASHLNEDIVLYDAEPSVQLDCIELENKCKMKKLIDGIVDSHLNSMNRHLKRLEFTREGIRQRENKNSKLHS